ncbi:MAG: UDP-N-acetylmuramoyl-L-alanyl-D-glutamate--2,6-diaminopimelate ligase [bacterium]|nr:UDP-N-acetylmuramoyl-L-alanyl-D-glutamate--2,6-diaminopimelate ligase [bacterium]
MRLKELISVLQERTVIGKDDIEIKDIECDSRLVKPNYLFVAIPGYKVDGHDFIPQAIRNGAKALVLQKELSQVSGITYIYVNNTRLALAVLSDKFYNHPSRKVKIIGITGTNGKTTTSYLIDSIFKVVNLKAAVIGTIAYQLGKEQLTPLTTTPSSLELQRILRKLVLRKFDYVTMEVSSHALSQDRVSACEFDVGVFTNMSLDHLDYHKTKEAYLNEKIKLFEGLGPEKVAIINIDDENSSEVIRHTNCRIITYGIKEKADVMAEDINVGSNFTSFVLKTKNGKRDVRLRLLGFPNVYNALAATAVSEAQGIPIDAILTGLESLKVVKGRFEKIDHKDFDVMIDYAHTPCALKGLLLTAKKITKNRIILVFGCGGDRDREKRPKMGGLASDLSDIFIITSDNPRSEDPTKIIQEIKRGVKQDKGMVIEDRYEAIKKALQIAEPGDIVLIAGKGHEDYQIIKDKRIPFSDKKVVLEILSSQSIALKDSETYPHLRTRLDKKEYLLS